jgi:hypothetical protein
MADIAPCIHLSRLQGEQAARPAINILHADNTEFQKGVQ